MRQKHQNFTSFSSSFLTIFVLSVLTLSIFPIAQSAALDEKKLTLTCKYEITAHNSQDDYTCTAINLENNRQDAEIMKINGKHLVGYESSNVKALIIENQNVTFLPMKIGELFEKLTRFEVRNSSLGEILKENFGKMDLKVLKIEQNPIYNIPVDAFEDLKNLEEVDLSWNKIENLDDGIFLYAEKLKILSLDGNKIKKLNANLLKNSPDLKKFSARNNEIQELDENLFENNKNLEEVTFTNNSLIQISPKIVKNLEGLQKFDFSGNPCLKDFSSFDEVSYIIDQLEGIFESNCINSDESSTDDTTIGDVIDEPTQKPEQSDKDVDISTTTLETTSSASVASTSATTLTTSSVTPQTTTPETTTTSVNITTPEATTNKTDDTNENKIIADLNQKVAELTKQVQFLINTTKNNTNSCVLEVIDENQTGQIEPPTTKKLPDLKEIKTNSTEDVKVDNSTNLQFTEAIPQTTDYQNITTTIPATQLQYHEDRKMSPEETFKQLDMVCLGWNTRNKSKAIPPTIIEKGENITVKGFMRDDRGYLMIEGFRFENSTEIINYEKIIGEKDANISKLENKVKELEEKTKKLTELEAKAVELVELEGKVKDLEEQNKIYLEKVTKLEEQNERITELEGKATKLIELEGKVKDLEEKNKEYLEKMTESQKNYEENLSKLSKLTSKVEGALKNQDDEESFDLDPEKTTIEKKDSEIPSFSSEASSSPDPTTNSSEIQQNSSLDVLDAEINLLLKKLDKLILQNSQKTSKLFYLDESLRNCQDNKFSLELDKKSNSLDIEDRNKTLLLFEEELNACKNKTSKLGTIGRNYDICRESNANYTNKVVELQNTIRDLQNEKSECFDKIKVLEMQNDEHKVEIEELKGQNNDQKEKIDEIGKQNGDQKEKIEELENQNDVQKEKIEELEKQDGIQKEKIEELEKQNDDQKEKIEELEKQDGIQKEKIEELDKQNGDKKEKIDVLKSQESKLKAQKEKEVKTCKAKVSNLKVQNDNKTAEISTCRQAYKEFKTANDDLFHKNKELNSKIQAATVQLTTCEEALINFSSFPIDCDIENVDGEDSCVARNVIALHPTMLVLPVDSRSSNLKKLQIVNSVFRFFSNSIFERFTDLKALEIIESGLLDLNEQNIESNLLINLRIEGNFISQIQNGVFVGVPNLQNLILASNVIKNIHDGAFRGLSYLKKLDLRNNRISTLNSNIFYYLQSLTHLSLSNNFVSELPGGLLAYQRYLQVVKFDSNPIAYIGEELLDYPNELEKVYFDGTCVRGTYNGIDETKLRIKTYCQRKN